MNLRAPVVLASNLAIFGVAAIALAVSAVAFVSLGSGTVGPAPAAQASTITLGVDVTTDGNSGSSLGGIEACKQVGVGESFDIDIFVTDVSGFRGWELYFAWDSNLLDLIDQQFLMVSGFDASESVPDSDGSHFLGVGATQPVAGSGVLARLTMQSLGAGQSNVAISHNPKWPFLNPGDSPVGDTNGDGAFDGPIIPARIAIGQQCVADPIITDTPAPTVTSPPTPSPTPSPSPTPTEVPTPSPTPTPSAVPTPSPTPAPPMRGDANCNGFIDTPDVIETLAGAAQVGANTPCSIRGDTNCSGGLDADDGLRLLRHMIGLAFGPATGCEPIGDPIV